MLNVSALTGRITKDLDLRYTQAGKAVASFILAVNRPFTNQNGENEADFITCVVWGKTAETMANTLHKGSLIAVEGRIQTRNYENQQGTRVYVTEVVVTTFSFLESKAQSGTRQQQNGTGTPNNGTGSGITPEQQRQIDAAGGMF